MFPQKNDMYSQEEMEKEFSAIFTQKDNLWDNTTVRISQSRDLFLSYAYLDYMSFNSCTEEYLRDSIANGTLKSRYVWLETDAEELINLCVNHKYEIVREGYGHIIFKR